MKPFAQALRLLFSSQSFSDGLRTTLAVLLPALIASYLNAIDIGILFSLGALCVSLTDTPGAIVNRSNTMLFCLVFIFITALLTAFAKANLYTMGLLVLVLSFFYSMFLVYGARGAAVGNAALLVMVLSMDHPTPPQGLIAQALFILSGGIWYTLISLVSYHARPFRPAQRTLGDCISALAQFMRIKADFYDCNKNLEAAYGRLVSQQMVVSEKQDAVREVLFKTRQIVKDSSTKGRKLLLAFTDTVDLFEETTITFYDYKLLRENFASTGVLEQVAILARSMADELNAIGVAIQTNNSYRPRLNMDHSLQQLKTAVDNANIASDQSRLVLKKLLVNIRRIMQRMEDLKLYFAPQTTKTLTDKLPLDRFVSHQSLEPRLLLDNLNYQSAVFRFSLRVAIAALVGFAISKFIAVGHHSYWILMTIIFMLKPSFSLTRQRNIERLGGTLAGGVAGVALLYFIQDKFILFSLMVLFMLCTYSLMRTHYLLSVTFMTPFLLILFHFLGVGFMQLLQERVMDTLLGCFIALLAGYLLFPTWESQQLTTHLRGMLKANSNYLFRVAEMLSGKQVSTEDYKLARKEVYVSSANLSAAFQRMLSEPRKTRKHSSDVQQFVVLNHILFSNTATLSSTLRTAPARVYPLELNRAMRKILNTLCTSLELLQAPCSAQALDTLKVAAEEKDEPTADEALLKGQLEFMQRLATDIAKSAEKIAKGL